MATMDVALFGEAPVFQATNAASDRHPVMPHNPSRSISATMSTRRPSMALRCPHNSATSSNNTANRSAGDPTSAPLSVATEDMNP